MAVLSKHGTELYRYEGLHYRLSFRADGNIMRDMGQGWKLFKRVKPNGPMTPAQYADRQRTRHAELDAAKPAFVAFRTLLHELVSFKARYHVLTALQTLAGDPDGLCVELQDWLGPYSDHNPDLSLDDCVALDRARAAAEAEGKEHA